MTARIDHLDLVVSVLDRSLGFYRGLLEPLGWTLTMTITGERGEPVHYLGGELGARPMAISLRAAAGGGRQPYDRYSVGLHHIAFAAESRAAVDARHRWALEVGAHIEDAPREYDYTHGYYALFLHDPDGIKLEVVHKPR